MHSPSAACEWSQGIVALWDTRLRLDVYKFCGWKHPPGSLLSARLRNFIFGLIYDFFRNRFHVTVRFDDFELIVKIIIMNYNSYNLNFYFIESMCESFIFILLVIFIFYLKIRIKLIVLEV